MTTEVSSEASNEMILATTQDETSNKRKLTTVISGTELNNDNEKKHQRTLSHSISLTGFDIQTKGREEYLSEIPPKAINLCSASYGARVLFATDEWFAKADNLLKDSAPEFDPDAYCEQGKVMDGWESRRRREEGHDWCLIQLGVPYWASAAPLTKTSTSSHLRIVGIELDTAHFTGNQTPQVSIELAKNVKTPLSILEQLPNGVERLLLGGRQGTGHSPIQVQQAQHAIQGLEFDEILPRTPLYPGHEATRYHYFPLEQPVDLPSDRKANTWVKLNYFPDGGVARMKFWAVEVNDDENEKVENFETVSLYMPIETGPICTVVPHGCNEPLPSKAACQEFTEISSDEKGGKGVACSNKHYGEPWRLIQTTSSKGMWDGWETARHSHRPSVVQQDPITKLSDTPLNDWAILKLGAVTNQIQKIILDTHHFLGNYPESILLEGCYYCEIKEGQDEEIFWKSSPTSVEWFPLVARTRMSPNAEHLFEKDQLSNTSKPITHVRLSIYPDGGCSRVRIYV